MVGYKDQIRTPQTNNASPAVFLISVSQLSTFNRENYLGALESGVERRQNPYGTPSLPSPRPQHRRVQNNLFIYFLVNDALSPLISFFPGWNSQPCCMASSLVSSLCTLVRCCQDNFEFRTQRMNRVLKWVSVGRNVNSARLTNSQNCCIGQN